MRKKRKLLHQATLQFSSKPGTFGPCQFCEYEPTHRFTGTLRTLAPTCELCGQREMAVSGILRQPEFYVI